MKRVSLPATFPYGRQRIGRSITQSDGTSIYTRLAGPENPDGKRARDIGVRPRRARGRRGR